MTPLADTTRAQLKAAIAKKGDFPSLSTDLNRILSSMEDQEAAEAQMVSVVLSDFALTQKVLRLANSAMYAAFGSNITTISMALYVLGSDTVGHLAMGLKLLDGLDKAADTQAARDELAKSVIAGAVARQVGASVSGKDGEAVAVAALIRGLGRLLTCFYLPEQFARIQASQPAADREAEAARAVLGLSFEEVAQVVLEDWRLPPDLAAMATGAPAQSGGHGAWVRAIADYSQHYVSALSEGADASQVRALAQRYATAIGANVDDLAEMANQAVEAVQTHEASTAAGMFLVEKKKRFQEQRGTPEEPPGSETLGAGVMEMEKAIEVLPLAQLLNMSLEVLSRGLGAERLMLFLRNKPTATYALVMGRGPGVAEKVKRLSFEEAFSPNVFHFALAKATPIYLNDALEERIQCRIPGWLKQAVSPAKAMLLIPVVVHGKPAGLLYLDWEKGRSAALTRNELALVDKLRELMGAALAQAVKPA